MVSVRILLIDDHAMLRSGLRMVLNASMPGIVIFEAGSLNEALESAPDLLDVTLLDIKLPGLSGVEGIALLKRKWPQVPVIMLSSQNEPETIRLALARGAAGFISKADSADIISTSINLALHGDFSALAAHAGGCKLTQTPLSCLTPRQCEVLDMLCQGMPNKSIARQLVLSENTVRGHVQAILAFKPVGSRVRGTSSRPGQLKWQSGKSNERRLATPGRGARPHRTVTAGPEKCRQRIDPHTSPEHTAGLGVIQRQQCVGTRNVGRHIDVI
jgi:DNA-binding NarL/FixJ family response regulator